MSRNRDALVAVLRGVTTEGNAAKDAIYSAVSLWTGTEVRGGDRLPLLRVGQVERAPSPTLLTGEPSVEAILSAAKLESRRDLSAKFERLRAFETALRAAGTAFEALDPSERVGPWRPVWRGGLEQRVIEAIGLYEAFPAVATLALEGIAAQIEDAEKKLHAFPSGAGRPRNEAAHRVAAELARLYVYVTGRRPTYSEGRDGLHGDYTPALRALFNAFGWRRIALRGPAEAALAAMTDEFIEETTRPRIGLFGMFSS